MLRSFQITIFLALANFFFTPALAHDSNFGYLHDVDGKLVPNSRGECVRNSFWTAEKAIPKCEGIEETKTMEPKSDPDSDGDGVADKSDNCPGTGSGISVDGNGCPLDRDNDGIPDYKDQCPDSKAGVAVDDSGCAIDNDTDKDGVANNIDQCPNTPAGRQVDAKGCKFVLTRTEEMSMNINFASNSSNVEQGEYPEIEQVANFLKKYGDVSTVIEGHTDDRGAASYNLNLSQSRANAVRNVLIERYGIAANRVTAKGYGEAKPISTNDTKAGRLANRRVVAVMKAQISE